MVIVGYRSHVLHANPARSFVVEFRSYDSFCAMNAITMQSNRIYFPLVAYFSYAILNIAAKAGRLFIVVIYFTHRMNTNNPSRTYTGLNSVIFTFQIYLF